MLQTIILHGGYLYQIANFGIFNVRNAE